jgi:hypothetical protein
MNTKKPISKYLAAAKTMPALRHNNEPFRIQDSMVARWLVSNPMVAQWIFNTARDKRLIVYDRKSKTWHGADFVAALTSAKPPTLACGEPGAVNA